MHAMTSTVGWRGSRCLTAAWTPLRAFSARRLNQNQLSSSSCGSRASAHKPDVAPLAYDERREAVSTPTNSGPLPTPDGFMVMHEKLRQGQTRSFVIKKEAWAKLFVLITSSEQARLAMQLMLTDASVRDANKWDWQAHGYGHTIFQLVQAAGAVRAYEVCDWVLENAAVLHTTVGRDTIPNVMRKFAAVGADTEEMERLYALEKVVRGSNSGSGFYELSRVYKRNGQAAELRLLLKTAKEEGVVLQETMAEDLEAWLGSHV